MKTTPTSAVILACCALLAVPACKEKPQQNTILAQPGSEDRPEMVSSGIGAKFNVPAGQVAIFEVVTRRGRATVAHR